MKINIILIVESYICR